jgi:hypothetical protein
VNSLPLGNDAIDQDGPNRGMYEQASAPEICAYFDRVMQKHLLPSGRVRYFPMCDYIGEYRFVSRLSGDRYEVKVRRKRSTPLPRTFDTGQQRASIRTGTRRALRGGERPRAIG